MASEALYEAHEVNSFTTNFNNPAKERQFREEVHGEWSRQLRVSLLPLAIVNFLWIYVDYLALGTSFEYALLTVGRVFLIAVVVWVISATQRSTSPISADVGAITFLLVQTVVGCGGMILKQEPASVYAMVGVFLILYIYILIPNGFIWTVVSAIFASGFFLASIAIASEPNHREFVSIIIIISMCNAGGAATSRRSHKLQRLRYALSVDEKAAREALEAEIEAKDNAVLAKNQFIAAASHDLRQPTQSLMLYGALLQQTDLGDTENKAVAGVVQSTKALQQMLNSLLDISRLEAGLINVETKNFELDELIEQLKLEIGPQANEKGIIFKSVSLKPVTLNTDPIILGRILRNLLLNAIKYTNSGGVLIGYRRRGKKIRIEIWDTGIGITEDLQEKVFDDFFQINNPGGEEALGLGLGLSTVRREAELLGLPVSLRSRLGHGSVFSIEAPIAAATPSKPEKTALLIPPSNAARLTILLIDNEQSILNSFKELVESWGHEVIVADAKNAAEKALKGAGVSEPDIIIADYRLSNNETGIEAITELRKAYSGKLRTAILTGDTASSELRELASSGIAILHKPLDPEQLAAFLTGDKN